jgi:hypothetical protein
MFKTLNIKEMAMLLGTLGLWGAELLLFIFVIPQHKSIYMDLTGLFFMLLSLIFVRYAVKIKQKQFTPRKEISIVMIFSMLPLLLSLTAILLYMYFVKKDAYLFLIIFGVFYVWFLVMKSAVLYKMDTKSKNSNAL